MMWTIFFATVHLVGFVSSIHAIMGTRTPQGTIACALSLNLVPVLAVPAYWVLGRSKFFLFNVIPYVTISMKNVQLREVSYNIPGDTDGSPPTANIVLKYEKITWSYHVINGSNMNLFSMDFTYDLLQRKDPSLGLSLGSMLNPFG